MAFVKRWVFATYLLTFIVIIAGGVVRTTQSGMGCPDWPKCFGSWIPPTHESQLPPDFEKYLSKQDIDHSFNAVHTWIEYFNRLFGALLGVFAIIQLAVLSRKRNLHRRSYLLAIAFLVLVILTGLFGALVVKMNLAHLSISIHLLFAILLLQIQLTLWLSVKERLFSIQLNRNTRNVFIGFLMVLLLQSIIGTLVRIHIDDISKLLAYQQREMWLADEPMNFLIHRAFSWIVVAYMLFILWKYNNLFALKRMMFALAFFVLLNVVIGITLYYAHMPAFAQPIHLLLASLAITQTMAILLRSYSADNKS